MGELVARVGVCVGEAVGCRVGAPVTAKVTDWTAAVTDGETCTSLKVSIPAYWDTV